MWGERLQEHRRQLAKFSMERLFELYRSRLLQADFCESKRVFPDPPLPVALCEVLGPFEQKAQFANKVVSAANALAVCLDLDRSLRIPAVRANLAWAEFLELVVDECMVRLALPAVLPSIGCEVRKPTFTHELLLRALRSLCITESHMQPHLNALEEKEEREKTKQGLERKETISQPPPGAFSSAVCLFACFCVFHIRYPDYHPRTVPTHVHPLRPGAFHGRLHQDGHASWDAVVVIDKAYHRHVEGWLYLKGLGTNAFFAKVTPNEHADKDGHDAFLLEWVTIRQINRDNDSGISVPALYTARISADGRVMDGEWRSQSFAPTAGGQCVHNMRGTWKVERSAH